MGCHELLTSLTPAACHMPVAPWQVLQQLADPDCGAVAAAGCQEEGDAAEMRYAGARSLLRCAAHAL